MKRADVAGRKPVIGWAGILAWRSDDLRELQGIIGPVMDEYGLTFYHAGILLDNPHIWGRSLQIMFTPIRVVCNNTLTAALRNNTNQENTFRMSHDRAFDDQIKQTAAEKVGVEQRGAHTTPGQATRHVGAHLAEAHQSE